MPDEVLEIDGARVPRFLYGTAWKEDETERLTDLALRSGFRGIDTANQRRHYFEAAVGKAIQAAIEEGLVMRDDLFLQTKLCAKIWTCLASGSTGTNWNGLKIWWVDSSTVPRKTSVVANPSFSKMPPACPVECQF